MQKHKQWMHLYLYSGFQITRSKGVKIDPLYNTSTYKIHTTMLGYIYKNTVQNVLHLFPTLDAAVQKAREDWDYVPYCAEDVKIICTNSFRIDQVNIPSFTPDSALYARYPRPNVSTTPLKFGETIEPTNIHV